MAIIADNGRVHIVRLSLAFDALPGLLEAHRARDPDTPDIEHQAADLIAKGFRASDTRAFVQSVCHWGGYAGVAGRVLKRNSIGQIIDCLRRAHGRLESEDVVDALAVVTEFKGLGVSFASKHLRFLDPARAVVLDCIISARLGYPMTPAGYEAFLADCAGILDQVWAAGVRTRSPTMGDGKSATSRWPSTRRSSLRVGRQRTAGKSKISAHFRELNSAKATHNCH